MVYIPKPPLVPVGVFSPSYPITFIIRDDYVPSITAYYSGDLTPEMIEEAFPADWTNPYEVAELIEIWDTMSGEDRAELLALIQEHPQGGSHALLHAAQDLDWYFHEYTPAGYLEGRAQTWLGALLNPLDAFWLRHLEIQLAAGFSFVQGFLAGWGSAWAGYWVSEWLGDRGFWSYIIGAGTNLTLIGIAGLVHDYLYYEQWGMDEQLSWYYDMSFRSGSWVGEAFGMYQIFSMNFENYQVGFEEGFRVGMESGWTIPDTPSPSSQGGPGYELGYQHGVQAGYYADWLVTYSWAGPTWVSYEMEYGHYALPDEVIDPVYGNVITGESAVGWSIFP